MVIRHFLGLYVVINNLLGVIHDDQPPFGEICGDQWFFDGYIWYSATLRVISCNQPHFESYMWWSGTFWELYVVITYVVTIMLWLSTFCWLNVMINPFMRAMYHQTLFRNIYDQPNHYLVLRHFFRLICSDLPLFEGCLWWSAMVGRYIDDQPFLAGNVWWSAILCLLYVEISNGLMVW